MRCEYATMRRMKRSAAKVLLVSPPFLPNFCRSQRWPVVNRTRAMRYPDWLAYCGGVLEQDGFELSFRDFIAEAAALPDVARAAAEFNPILIVLDVTTPSLANDLECARLCKQAAPASHIALVGPHVTVFPRETLQEAGGAADSVALGEYDHTIRELARALAGGNDLSGVLGLAWRSDDGIIVNQRRPLIEELDAIPFPAWRHLDVRRYRNNTYLYPYLDQISGRGCPNGCTFCQWPQVMLGRRYRYTSPERVVAELTDAFDRFAIREMFFEDDTLTTDHERLREICRIILKQKKRLVWSCNARVDPLDFDTLCLMKEAGCRMLLIGPESGTQAILDNVRKGITLEQTREFVAQARRAGLLTHSCWVMGLPGETRSTMQATIDFALELDTDTIQASSVMPQVGTELYDWAVANSLLKADSWQDYSRAGEQTAVMEYPDLSQAEMNAAVNSLLRKYYLRPRVVARLLRQSVSNPSLLASYSRGAIMLLRYLFTRARLVEG